MSLFHAWGGVGGGGHFSNITAIAERGVNFLSKLFWLVKQFHTLEFLENHPASPQINDQSSNKSQWVYLFGKTKSGFCDLFSDFMFFGKSENGFQIQEIHLSEVF